MSITRYQAACSILERLGMPITTSNSLAFVAWMAYQNCDAENNPLATEFNTGSSVVTDFNSVGVKNYPSWNYGVSCTVLTLLNGMYSNLLSVIPTGDFTSIVNAIDASPWGGSNVSQFTEASVDQAMQETLINSTDSLPYPPSITTQSTPPTDTPTEPVLTPTGSSGSAPRTYRVMPGDTLTGIATNLGVSESALFDANQFELDTIAQQHGFPNSNNGNRIWPGTILKVP